MKLDKVDLNLLPVLDAIITHESVSHAALELGLSKAAASHALARIRKQVGDPILVRAGQRWVLTERAQLIAPRLHATVREAQSLLTAVRTFDPRELRREFRIHATDQMLSLLGLTLGHRVSEEAPNVSLRFLPVEANDADPLRTNVDLTLGVSRQLAPELRTQKLFEDRFVCVARVGHPVIKGTLSLEGFLAAKHVGLAPRGGPGSVVDAALEARDLSRRAVRWVPYSNNAVEFVAESDCIATISALRPASRSALRPADHRATAQAAELRCPPGVALACRRRPGAHVAATPHRQHCPRARLARRC